MAWRRELIGAVVLIGLAVAVSAGVERPEPDAQNEIAAFNKRYLELHQNTDTAGILALWSDDGVDLMPGEPPVIGKKKITAWLEDVMARIPGYKVIKQEMEFRDIHTCGDWASEWVMEHQIVQPPDGKTPIEVFGKAALVLHRETGGAWKVQQEMWSAAPKP
jgi:ketosteroid isomerase-like protein